MVKFQEGYYIEDTGPNDDDAPDVFVYYMGGEPPLEQYILINGVWLPLECYGLHDGAWVLLVDGFYLADRLIDGDPSFSDPTDEPPEGVPPFDPTAPKQPPRYRVFRDGSWVKLADPVNHLPEGAPPLPEPAAPAAGATI